MKASQEKRTIRSLVKLRKQNLLKVNAEYQRGAVWKEEQRKKLIDSVLRGYPLPLIYLHHVSEEVEGFKNEGLEIIDGQQRINALFDFSEGAFKLFDPIKDDEKAKFPSFIKEQPCPWAGKDMLALDQVLQDKFLDTELSVAMIETDLQNEVRDLFVRLQSGLPLNGQEVRDSWPGQFTEFILKTGGKPEIARYPGHEFFTKTLGMKPQTDRGTTRQLAAQIATQFLFQRKNGREKFSDINSPSINDTYYTYLDFDAKSPEAKRLLGILDIINNLLCTGKHAKLRGHDAMHAVMLVDLLMDDYTRGWEEKFPHALDRFLEGVASGKASKNSDDPNEYWTNYAQWTRVNSDRGDTIGRRHTFYLGKMFEFMQPLQLKDPNRIYGEVERTLLYYKQAKICAVCDAQMTWSDVEVHHVVEHSKGGQTALSNGAAVHKACHPKGVEQTRNFASKFGVAKDVKDLA